MIISIKYCGMNPPSGLDGQIEDRLITLSKAASITEASIFIEHLTGAPLTYRTELSVSVPGADFQIQAFDSSAEFSFNRALAMLEKRLRLRAMQRARQVIDAGMQLARATPKTAVTQTRMAG